MALPQGIDFRATVGFVTDVSPNDFAKDTTAYPHTTAQGNTCGWEIQSSLGSADQSVQDPRLSGIVFISNAVTTVAVWRFDLPSAGNYNLQCAAGNPASTQTPTVQVFDTNALAFTVCAASPTAAANSFFDATGVVRTAAAWVALNGGSKKSFNFSSTICRFKVGDSSGTSPDFSVLAYAYVESGGGGTYSVSPNPFAKPGIGGPPVIAKQFSFQGSTFIPPTGGGSFTGTPIAGQLIKTGQNPTLQTALNLTTVAGNKPITGGIPTLTFARNLSTIAGNLLKSGQVPNISFSGSYVQTTIPGNKPIAGLVPNIIIQAPRTGGGGYPYEDVPWTREQNRKLRARIDEETAKHKKLERELVVAEKTLEKAPVRRIEAARNDVERKHQQLMAVAKELMRLHDEVSRETRRRDDDDAVILLLH